MTATAVWMLLVTAGTVGGSIGPLPFVMEKCRAEAAREQERFQRAAERAVADGRIEAVPDYRFICVEASRRPELGSPFGG